jgi:hypothetical protein
MRGDELKCFEHSSTKSNNQRCFRLKYEKYGDVERYKEI